MNNPKILLFDIETSPNLAYTWGKYDQNVIDFVQEWELLCYGWKWLGEKKVKTLSKREAKGEKGLVKNLWELFNEADIIVAHNGDRFDIKKANAKFLEHGLQPPAPYKTVDTLKVARKYFNFNSNKLNDLSVTLNIGKKAPTGGFELWLGCMRDDVRAWKTMTDYCKQDVNLLEMIYKAMLPWMTNHPNRNILQGTTHNCPNCGGKHTQKRGISITRIGKRQRYHCQSCGAWSVGELIATDVIVR